jgi:hypothetical protein
MRKAAHYTVFTTDQREVNPVSGVGNTGELGEIFTTKRELVFAKVTLGIRSVLQVYYDIVIDLEGAS